MDKKNLLVIGCVLLLAVLAMALVPLLPRTEAAEDMVVIRVQDEEYARIPLSQPQTLTITQESGAVNVVRVTEQGVLMQSSTCDNQVCVHKGEVTLNNWELKGAVIYCAPNQVILELVEAQEE